MGPAGCQCGSGAAPHHQRTAGPAPRAVILATLTYPLRLIRWRLLLRDERGEPYPSGPLWHAIALGFTANNLLPLRAGELIRSYTAARLAHSAVHHRDLVRGGGAHLRCADCSCAADLRAAPLGSAELGHGGRHLRDAVARAAGVVGMVALLLAIMVVAAPVAAEKLVRRLLPSTRLADRIVHLIEGVRHGLAVLRSPGRLAGVIFWSLVIWLVNALAFYLAFAAFDIPVSYAGALLMQGLLVLGISVPSTPGFFGPFEAVIVAVLALYGIPGSLAFSYAIAFHVTTLVPITLLGLWSLTRTPEGFGVLRRTPP